MKHFAMLLSFLVAPNLMAATDYSYCQKHFNKFKLPNKPCDPTKGMYEYADCVEKTNKKDMSYYPFELTSEGKIKPHPTANLSVLDGKEIITAKNIYGLEEQAVVERNDKGELVNVETTRISGGHIYSGFGFLPDEQTKDGKDKKDSKADFPDLINTQTDKFELKNGKCIPTRTDTVNSIGKTVRQDVNYDLKLCKDLNKFFKENPEAASCFDKGLMQKADNIFSDYYANNKDIYGTVKKNNWINRPSPLKTNTGRTGFGMYPGMGPDMAANLTMTPDQMVTPLGMTLDNTLQNWGASPVALANSILQFMCRGQGMMPSDEKSNTQAIIDDESVWAEAPAVENTVKSENVKK